MYMTRHQRQLSASIDENKVPHVKAVPSKAAGNGKAVGNGNNRRTLGDIGNLVGALSVRCNVSKDGIVEIPKQEPALDRPITRSFRVNSNGIQKKEIGGEETAWGTKQRRTTITDKVQLPGSALDHGVNVDQVSGPSARVKGVLRRGVAAKKKEPTLTALLTARSQAACGLGDLEMRDAEDPLPDIDQSDSGNQLAVVDYVEDIYSFYRKTEMQSCVSPDYMSKQADINHKMRAILIDWLIEVHYKFKLMPETLFLTINIIDRFLACESVSRKHLQLVGCTAMLLASKYEEIWAPEVQDFVFISDNAYTKEQVLSMEKKMLNTLSFNLTVPTPYVFLVRLLKAASSDEQMNMLSFFLVELCLTDYTMVKFPPSHLAAAAVYTAHCTLQRPPYWTYVLKRHSGYSEWQLKECATMMVELHKKAAEGSLKVVYKKYSIAKMSSVSLLSPASLPLPSVSSFCS